MRLWYSMVMVEKEECFALSLTVYDKREGYEYFFVISFEALMHYFFFSLILICFLCPRCTSHHSMHIRDDHRTSFSGLPRPVQVSVFSLMSERIWPILLSYPVLKCTAEQGADRTTLFIRFNPLSTMALLIRKILLWLDISSSYSKVSPVMTQISQNVVNGIDSRKVALLPAMKRSKLHSQKV